MFEELPNLCSNTNFLELIRETITQQMIMALKNGEIDCNDSMAKEYVYLSITNQFQLEFLKAVGLTHFKDDEKAQLIINDFIGLLNDMYTEGDESLNEFSKQYRR